MADIISRIVLQASGGDQVAREIGKISTAAKTATKDVQGISRRATGAAPAGFDAFDRAVQNVSPEMEAQRRSDNAEHIKRTKDRMDRHESVANNRILQTQSQLVQAGQMVGGGDPMGAAGGIMQMFGKAGIAGAIVAGIGMATMAVNKLAKEDIERRRQIWTSGMGPRLGGQNFTQFYGQVIGLQQTGMAENIMPYMAGLAAGGGQWNVNTAERLNRINMMWGVDANMLGTLAGRMQQAGVGTGRLEGGQLAGLAAASFGRAGMGEFYSTIGKTLENAMVRGFTRGSEALGGITEYTSRRLAELTQIGGLTPMGATAMFESIQQAIAAPERGLQTPEHAFRFLMARRPGQTYVETLRNMTTPESETEIFNQLKMQYGGNKEALQLATMRTFGLTAAQAIAYVETGKAPLKVAKEPGIDDETSKKLAAEWAGKEFGVNVQNVAGDIKANVINYISGSGEAIKALGASREMGGGIAETYSRIFAINTATNAYTLGLGNLLKLSPFAASQQGLSEILMYGEYAAGRRKPSIAEEAKYKNNAVAYQEALAEANRLSPYLETGQVKAVDLENTIRAVNKEKKYDDDKNTITIVEVLMAIREILGKVSNTDAGSTN